MIRNTKTTDQLNALVRLCNESIVEPSRAACNAQAIRAGLLELIADPLLRNPPFDKDAEEKMTRPEAVRILMQLQKVEARAGNANIVRAYEMAIAYIVKRHSDGCRNRANLRARKAAKLAAKKEAV